jgi:hypothetical protein
MAYAALCKPGSVKRLAAGSRGSGEKESDLGYALKVKTGIY